MTGGATSIDDVIRSLDKYMGHGTRDIPTRDIGESCLLRLSNVGMSLVPCPMYLSNDLMT